MPGHGLASGKINLRDNRQRTRYRPIRVTVLKRGIARHVGDSGGVQAAAIADIHVLQVTRAHAITWEIHLSRCQRQPAHGSAAAQRQCHPRSRPAHPGYQRGGVDGVATRRCRNPAPPPSGMDPAAVMEWRKAPRGPPAPMARAVRPPIVGDLRWNPDVAVIGLLLPLAIIVQVFVADDIARDILRYRLIIGPARLSLLAPAIEIVGWPRLRQRIGAIGAVQAALSGQKIHVLLVATDHLGLTIADGHAGVAGVVDTEAIFARAQQRYRGVRGVDFEGAGCIQVAYGDVHGAGIEAQLHRLVTEIEYDDAAALIETHDG